MLELKVHDGEKFVVLRFEHSLLSVSKWESKYRKPFLSNTPKSASEMFDYYEMMLLSPEVDPNIIVLIEPENFADLTEYINQPQTASSVPEEPRRSYNAEVVTSELIYYWMTQLQIPFEAEKWHLSRLLMLVQIANFKQKPPKKRSAAETMKDWREINEIQKKKLGITG